MGAFSHDPEVQGPSRVFTAAVGDERQARTDLEAATAALRRAVAALQSAQDRPSRAAARDARLSAVHDKASAALRAAAAALADVENTQAQVSGVNEGATAEMREANRKLHEAKQRHDSAEETDSRAAAANRDSAAELGRAARRIVADEQRARDAARAVSDADRTLADMMALAEYADESFGRVSAYVAEVRERALQRRVAAEQARRRAAEARKNAEEVIESTRRLRPMGDVGYDAVRADAARCPDLVARAPADVRSRGTGDAGVMACATHLEPRSEGGTTMGKVIECAKVDPSSGCTHVVRGATEEEVLKNAMEHATQHGIRDVTPELMAKVKGAIRDEK